jgi:pyruvate-formate lyase-activating enzyme
VQFATPLPGTALARGRSLPVVADWGPRFQTEPTPLAAVDADELLQFKATFDAWMRDAEGPARATIQLTHVCNQDCVFCAVGPRTGLGKHPSGPRQELVRLRRRGFTAVDFDGGEPTLHPELLPLARYARAAGFSHVGLTTNGRMAYYEDFARKLVGSGLTSIVFSVHGPDAESHGRHVGVPEAFEQTCGGIRHCVRHAPPGVRLAMATTITRYNVAHLGALAELAQAHGLRAWSLLYLAPFGRGTAQAAPDLASASAAIGDVLDRWSDRLAIEVRGAPFCWLPRHTRFVTGDPARLAHRHVRIDSSGIDAAAYVASERTPTAVCAGCPHAIFCSGFPNLANPGDPPWLLPARALVRAPGS